MPIHDRCCAGLSAAAYRRGAVLCAGGRLYDTLALVEWYRLWLNGSGFGRGIREKFCGSVVLVLGWFWRWQVYCLFTVGKCIVCVCCDVLSTRVRVYVGVFVRACECVRVQMYVYVSVYLCQFE